MDKSLLNSLQRLAYQSLKDGNVWQAILSQMYLDIEIMNETIFDEVSTNNATLSRVALGTSYPTTYGEQEFDALYVVQAARNGLISAVPEDMQERVLARLTKLDYLKSVTVPTVGQIAVEAKKFRGNEESHGYLGLKQNFATLYDRSANKALRSGKISTSDVLALVLLSDQSAFDAHLIRVSQDHRDWLLNTMMVRKALYQSYDNTNLEAEDIYTEIHNRRSDLMSTISHLQETDRVVKWAFNVETVAHTQRQSVSEESAA